MLEKTIQKRILKYLRSKDFYCIKMSDYSRAGIPDIYCARCGNHYWFEVKTPESYSRSMLAKNIQSKTIEDLRHHNVRAFIVCSVEQVSDIIESYETRDL